jgi:hypothetical protein
MDATRKRMENFLRIEASSKETTKWDLRIGFFMRTSELFF